MDFEGRPGQLGYFWRLATTLLVALAASAFCTPALAQSTTEHCTSSSLELWCATLVVGNKSGESLYGYGGGATVAESDDFGSLSDSQFTFKGETWDIEGLVFSPRGRRFRSVPRIGPFRKPGLQRRHRACRRVCPAYRDRGFCSRQQRASQRGF